ncbi:MAG: SDR family NAD(P)-dependent oxidoreductase [Bryobacteraceae bacterium]
MKDFTGRVAVITGAASGIGLAMARRFQAEGMRLVLADLNGAALEGLVPEFPGAKMVVVDVANAADIERLANEAFEEFGAVHVLCNNAGIGSRPYMTWQHTEESWDNVIGINLRSVIHGVRVFVPRMLAQGSEGHIVNTASMAGHGAAPLMGPYNVTKYGVVALSEVLHFELQVIQSKLRVSVLCPGFVKTNIAVAAEGAEGLSAAQEDFAAMIRQRVEEGIPAEGVAERVLDAIRDEQFWILTHADYLPGVTTRAEAIVSQTNPPMPELVKGAAR